MSKKRIESARQILKSFTNEIPTVPFDSFEFRKEVSRAERAIAEVEKELAKQLAVLEFLDLQHDKVKVSKRKVIVPKYARAITK